MPATSKPRWTIKVTPKTGGTFELYGVYTEFGQAETLCVALNRKLAIAGMDWVATPECVRTQRTAKSIIAHLALS